MGCSYVDTNVSLNNKHSQNVIYYKYLKSFNLTNPTNLFSLRKDSFYSQMHKENCRNENIIFRSDYRVR